VFVLRARSDLCASLCFNCLLLCTLSACVCLCYLTCTVTHFHECTSTLCTEHNTLNNSQASQAADSAAKSITNPSRWGQKWQAASNTGKANTAKPSGTTLNNGFTSSLKDAVSSVQDALPNADDVNVPSGIKDAGRQVKNKVCVCMLALQLMLSLPTCIITVLKFNTVVQCYLTLVNTDGCSTCCCVC
jgi:hypothetical protein